MFEHGIADERFSRESSSYRSTSAIQAATQAAFSSARHVPPSVLPSAAMVRVISAFGRFSRFAAVSASVFSTLTSQGIP